MVLTRRFVDINQDRRVEELAGKALAEDRRAQLIEYNLAEVDGAINAVSDMLDCLVEVVRCMSLLVELTICRTAPEDHV